MVKKFLEFTIVWAVLVLVPSLVNAEARRGEFLIKFNKKSATSDTAKKRSEIRKKLRVRIKKEFAFVGTQVVLSDDGEFDHKAAKELLASGDVEYIEPNYIYYASTNSNDERQSELWGFNNLGGNNGTADVDIDAPEAWEITQGSGDVVVGVVDTGVNYNHPDLAANMWTNTREVPGNGIDDDGNGVADDVHGFNAHANNGNPLDDNGHGTHCAGTIAAVGNNTVGVAGVNWRAKIMALKFLSSTGAGSVEDAISAINYAIKARKSGVNLRVLSNSWGGPEESQALADAVKEANVAGILFAAAAGNDSSDNDASPNYPSNINQPNVLAVGAIDRDGNMADFSNYGATTVHIAAPGVSILSTWSDGGYKVLSGTSMATPHAAGVAALLSGNEPGLTAALLKERIINTVKPLPATGGLMIAPGTISAFNALTNKITPLPPPDRLASYTRRSIGLNNSSDYGTQILNVDDGYVEINLPFSFTYYREQFSRLAISSNGRAIPLRPEDLMPMTADYSNKPMPGIAAYHDDLVPSADGGVFLKTSGSEAVITWIMIPYFLKNSADAQAPIKFQLAIDQSGSMEFRYIDTATGIISLDAGSTATVGIGPISSLRGERMLIGNNLQNDSLFGSGKAIGLYPKKFSVKNDFDGDSLSDIAFFNARKGGFRALLSTAQFRNSDELVVKVGKKGDSPFICDIDGDLKADFLAYRPSKLRWYYRASSSNYRTEKSIAWGAKKNKALVGDFDGDGKCDLGLADPAASKTSILLSTGGFNVKNAAKKRSNAVSILRGLAKGEKFLVADFSGDGGDEFTRISNSALNLSDYKGQRSKLAYNGTVRDMILGCDINGDGASDTVVVRSDSNGGFGWEDSVATPRFQFGMLGDAVSCTNDFDGDGKGDATVFRSYTGQIYYRGSNDGADRQPVRGLADERAIF